jgi:hypothetical protein
MGDPSRQAVFGAGPRMIDRAAKRPLLGRIGNSAATPWAHNGGPPPVAPMRWCSKGGAAHEPTQPVHLDGEGSAGNPPGYRAPHRRSPRRKPPAQLEQRRQVQAR